MGVAAQSSRRLCGRPSQEAPAAYRTDGSESRALDSISLLVPEDWFRGSIVAT
jgi:hypothetical protein